MDLSTIISNNVSGIRRTGKGQGVVKIAYRIGKATKFLGCISNMIFKVADGGTEIISSTISIQLVQ